MKRLLLLAVTVAAVLALPATAWAHAVLLRTVPAASVTVDAPPRQLSLTFSEAVEPRFAIVSVTDAAGRGQTAGPPRRSAASPDTLESPLKRLAEGWYLVFWRAISADGHPVRGAFTFAIGPNAGPAPQFVIPSISETAATPQLLVARWMVFLSLMAAVGLFVLRMATARPLVRRVAGSRLRAVSIAFWIAITVALVATPVYVLLATAQFSLRSAFDVGALVPLVRVSGFGRGYLDLEFVLALFAVAAAVALWVDRPERETRSVAELLAGAGAYLAAGAVLLVPGLAGHAAQTSPRGLSLMLDWLHLAAGSIWVGGLVGVLVLWRSLPAARRTAGLGVAVPRFSNTAFVSVLALIGTGVGATLIHLPTLGSLYQTSYGKSILLKVALLLVAMLLGAVNVFRTKPRLAEGDAAVATSAARLLRRLVSGEVVLVLATIFAAVLLSSLAPPSKALAAIGHASGSVGPGPVTRVVEKNGYKIAIRVSPNRAAVPNSFSVEVSRNGEPVLGAEVTTSFDMLDMTMPRQTYQLSGGANGLYQRDAPALVMVGHWGLTFTITPPHAAPFDVLILDRANG